MTSQLKLICVLAHPDKFLKAIEVGRNLDFCLLELTFRSLRREKIDLAIGERDLTVL